VLGAVAVAGLGVTIVGAMAPLDDVASSSVVAEDVSLAGAF
jgi:hypothetical protein